MLHSKNSLDTLVSKLNEYICYISYKKDGFIYNVPCTNSTIILNILNIKHDIINGNENIICYNLITETVEKLNYSNVLSFKYKSDIKKSIDDIKRFKTNLNMFKKEHLENMSDEFLRNIITIDRASLFNDNEKIYKKVLFLSKNLYFIKFIDFLEISSISEIKKLLNDDELILSKLKSKWIEKIDHSKQDALKYVEEQLLLDDTKSDIAFVKSLNEIKDTIIEYDYVSEINSLNTISAVLETWPSIFLPAPEFVNKLNKNYTYNKL